MLATSATPTCPKTNCTLSAPLLSSRLVSFSFFFVFAPLLAIAPEEQLITNFVVCLLPVHNVLYAHIGDLAIAEKSLGPFISAGPGDDGRIFFQLGNIGGHGVLKL